MNDDNAIYVWLIAARAVHFAACLLLLGVWTFDRLILAPVKRRQSSCEPEFHPRNLLWITLPIALLSGAIWFAMVAINISGLPPRQAMQLNNLRLVNQTQFGTLWQLRLIFWIATAMTSIISLSRRESLWRWLALFSSGVLTASLAWAGHGLVGRTPAFHLAIDVLHLLAAGIWPAGLSLSLLLLKIRRHTSSPSPGASLSPSPGTPAFGSETQARRGEGRGEGLHPTSLANITPPHPLNLSALARKFSTLSLISVATLAITGVINTWIMMNTLSDLWQTTYGRLLLAKIIVFFLMAAIGAINVLFLIQRLPKDRAADRLRSNVVIELILSNIVIGLVAILGSGLIGIPNG